MKKKFKLTSNDIATAGVFLAFILIFMLVPFTSLFGVDLAFIPLIAVCLAATVKGFGMGLFTGISFGIASLAASYIHPNWTAPMFHNPAVSILPRVIIPITVYFSFKLVKKLLRNKREDVSTGVASTVSTVIGVCTNTLLVLSTWAIFYFGDTFTLNGDSHTITGALFVSVLTSNFLVELIICTVLCPVICTAVRIALGIDKRGKRLADVAPNDPVDVAPNDTADTPSEKGEESPLEETKDQPSKEDLQ